MIGLTLSIAVGCTRVPRGGISGLPTCVGTSDCAAGPLTCIGEDQTASIGPTIIANSSTGLMSDGRGAYNQRTDGVRHSIVMTFASMSLDGAQDSIKNSRHYLINLSNPVPGENGVPLGIVTAGANTNFEIQWRKVGHVRRNLHDISIGQTVTAGMVDVTFHIDDHFFVLQAGPLPYGHCHAAPTRVNGTGTSSGTIYRASATRWVVDLPAGSVGRLYDLHNTDQFAVDRGLYYTDLHVEMGS